MFVRSQDVSEHETKDPSLLLLKRRKREGKGIWLTKTTAKLEGGICNPLEPRTGGRVRGGLSGSG